MKRDLVSIHDLSRQEVADITALGAMVKANPEAYSDALAGKTLGMIFQKSSTRTRVSFQVGIYQLGGMGLFLSSKDIQLGRGEPLSDTAQVLSRYMDGIMARTFAHSDVTTLATYASIPVINGLTDLLHPCQALADVLTIREHFGRCDGLKMTYIGDGNNMAHSLMFAASKAGMDFACAAPTGYWMDTEVVAQGQADADAAGTSLVQTTSIEEAVAGADVVYTDVWASMGQEDESKQRIKDFEGFCVDARVMSQADPKAIFLHCLPAHRGEEVSAEVCDGPQSIIFEQAENRLHAQKAIMLRLMGAQG
ncbi:MAG: ornithine carbamoyltransferase [Myxococcota bacterium]